MNPFFLGLELGAAGFFAIVAIAALRRGRLPFLELISAAAFGVLLEEGDQLIFGTYHYSPDFILTVDRAPIVIGLTWALVIAGAMRITDALGVRRRYAPVVDAVLAISLDLAFDAVAIRMGLWTWRNIAPTDGWFGVPAGNFYAWLFVTFGFSLISRWLRDATRQRPSLEWLQLAVPLPAFGLLLAGLMPFVIVKPMVDSAPGGGLAIFAVALAIFVGISLLAVFGPHRMEPDGQSTAILDLRLAFASRLAIHLLFLVALFVLGLATTAPMLLAISLAMLALEVPLSALTHRRLTAAESRVRSGDSVVGAQIRAGRART